MIAAFLPLVVPYFLMFLFWFTSLIGSYPMSIELLGLLELIEFYIIATCYYYCCFYILFGLFIDLNLPPPPFYSIELPAVPGGMLFY